MRKQDERSDERDGGLDGTMTLTRRDLGKLGLGLVLAAGGIAAAARRAVADTEPPVTEVPESQPLVTALGYVAKSPIPDQKCANCALFLGKPGDASGKCGLFPKGVVNAEGHCNSWSKKTA